MRGYWFACGANDWSLKGCSLVIRIPMKPRPIDLWHATIREVADRLCESPAMPRLNRRGNGIDRFFHRRDIGHGNAFIKHRGFQQTGLEQDKFVRREFARCRYGARLRCDMKWDEGARSITFRPIF